MARLYYRAPALRATTGAVAAAVGYVVYSDSAGTTLADIASTQGGSSIAGSAVTTDALGLLEFWGPAAGTTTLYLRCPAQPSLGVQRIDANPDDRLDVLEAAGSIATHEADTTAIHGITDTAQLVTLNTTQTISGEKTHSGHTYFTTGRPQVDVRAFATLQAAINAAPSGAIINLGPGTLAAQPAAVTPKSGQIIKGTRPGATVLTGTTGQDYFTMPGNPDPYYHMGFEGFSISGGRRGFYNPNISTYVTLRDIEIAGPTAECILVDGSIEEWTLDNCYLNGGTYGVRMTTTPTVAGTNNFDKNTFTGVTTINQSKSGWLLEQKYAYSNVWIRPFITHAQEHGFVCDGEFRGNSFHSVYCEANGKAGKNNRTTLSGTVSTGATSATLASATGWATGDTITIQGADTGGRDLTKTSVTISGTTVSWTGGTVTTVTNPAVTNAVWDDFNVKYTLSGIGAGAPRGLSFVGGILGQEASNGKIRYSLNLPTNTGGTEASLWGTAINGGCPVYDPLFTVNCDMPGVRRPGLTDNAIVGYHLGAGALAYAEAGALKYRGTSGTVTVIGSA